MEDSEEIESFYGNELERLDNEFLEKFKFVKNKESLVKLEEEYNRNTNQLLGNYNNQYSKYLDIEKKKEKERDWIEEHEKEKKENEDPKEDELDMSKPFESKRVNMKLSFKDSLNFRWDVFKFKLRIRIRNFSRNYIPSIFFLYFFKLKLSLRFLGTSIKNKNSELTSSLKNWLKISWEKIKEFFKSLSSWFKKFGSFVVNIKSKILRKKTEENKKGEGNNEGSGEEKKDETNSENKKENS